MNENSITKTGIKTMLIIMAALLVVVMIVFAGIWNMLCQQLSINYCPEPSSTIQNLRAVLGAVSAGAGFV